MTAESCPWCGTDPLYQAYHDDEWGVPETDPRALWEKLVLDGFQAGPSWITILKKRDNFRATFDGFDPRRVARWGEAEVARALADPGIVRHRGKIEATVAGARNTSNWRKDPADSRGFCGDSWVGSRSRMPGAARPRCRPRRRNRGRWQRR